MQSGGGPRGNSENLNPRSKIYVGNIAFETTEETIRKKFQMYGPVKEVKVKKI